VKFLAGHDLPNARSLRRSLVALEDIRARLGIVDAGPAYDVAGLPLVTPETWVLYRDHTQARRDQRHHASECPLCAHWDRIEREQYAAPWRASEGGTRSVNRARWGSAEAALEWYATMLRDGYPSGSVTGTLEAFGAHGCWIQQDGRKADRAEKSADDRATMERAVRLAFDDEPEWRVLAAVLLARKGLREPIAAEEVAGPVGKRAVVVAAVVRRGMRGVRVYLASRGLVPMPRRGTRLHAEVLEEMQRIETCSNAST
jgi:hypothetical protein